MECTEQFWIRGCEQEGGTVSNCNCNFANGDSCTFDEYSKRGYCRSSKTPYYFAVGIGCFSLALLYVMNRKKK